MKKLKKFLSIVALITCISTLCFAEEADDIVTTSLEGDINPIAEYDEDIDLDGLTEEELAELYEQYGDPSNEEEDEQSIDVHEGDFSITGDTIEVSKAINGNAYIFGTDVTITGMVYGDMYVAATSSLTFAKGSVVFGNVFAVSPTIKQTGVISSLYALATEEYTCDYEGTAEFDIKVVSKRIIFHGYVQRHVYFWASEYLDLTEDTYIVGNLNYHANNIHQDESAIIKGETYAHSFDASDSFFTSSATTYGSLTISFITTITLLLVAFLAILLVKPSAVTNTSKHLTQNVLTTFFCGLVACILIPILILICLLVSALKTVAFILLALFIIGLALSLIIVTIGLAKYLDEKIKKTKDSNSILAYVLIVIVAFWVLLQIPYIQVITMIAIGIFGLGTIIVSLHDSRKKEVLETPENKPATEEKKD